VHDLGRGILMLMNLVLGRFREFYYWDTYWIVKALLHCDMSTTVKGIIENFLSMVRTHGIVPNGGRIYYLKRSQPPFLTLMVKVCFVKIDLNSWPDY
jgi:alpha,alpha-trehalase